MPIKDYAKHNNTTLLMNSLKSTVVVGTGPNIFFVRIIDPIPIRLDRLCPPPFMTFRQPCIVVKSHFFCSEDLEKNVSSFLTDVHSSTFMNTGMHSI